MSPPDYSRRKSLLKQKSGEKGVLIISSHRKQASAASGGFDGIFPSFFDVEHGAVGKREKTRHIAGIIGKGGDAEARAQIHPPAVKPHPQHLTRQRNGRRRPHHPENGRREQ